MKKEELRLQIYNLLRNTEKLGINECDILSDLFTKLSTEFAESQAPNKGMISDEEIEGKADDYYLSSPDNCSSNMIDAFCEGAKWMRSKYEKSK